MPAARTARSLVHICVRLMRVLAPQLLQVCGILLVLVGGGHMVSRCSLLL